MFTKKELHVERIEPNSLFMQENVSKAKHFFEVAILPELLGRWFSRPEQIAMTASNSTEKDISQESSTSSDTEASSSGLSAQGIQYCFCQQGEYGEMIGCDNNSCYYQWFHLDCLKLQSAPRSKKWYCPECRKLKKSKSLST